MEKHNIEYFLSLDSLERTQVGIFEEKLLTLFFKYNKIPLSNIYFVKQNQLEVEELYDFICSKYEKIENKIEPKMPIIITQSNFKGKFYDIIILIPIPNTDSYDAIFVQIGLNKTITEINKLQKDIAINHNKYRDGIVKYIGVNISNIYLHSNKIRLSIMNQVQFTV